MGWDGPLTHRQFLAWTEWLDSEWNIPSRSDWYQAQTAFEVARIRQMLSANPEPLALGEFLLPFGDTEETQRVEPDQDYIDAQKSLWAGVLGIPTKEVFKEL